MLIKNIDVMDGNGLISVAVSSNDYERLSLYLKDSKKLFEENQAEELNVSYPYLSGIMQGYTKAINECLISAPRESRTVGARNCMEIKEAIDKLYYAVLNKLYPVT